MYGATAVFISSSTLKLKKKEKKNFLVSSVQDFPTVALFI
jgi:hypothetical protein